VRRRKLSLPPSEAAEEAVDPRSEETARSETREAAERVEALFGVLSDDQRRILTLRFRHGLGFREIAQILGIKQGTIAGGAGDIDATYGGDPWLGAINNQGTGSARRGASRPREDTTPTAPRARPGSSRSRRPPFR